MERRRASARSRHRADRHLAAAARGPGGAELREEGRQLVERVLGELAVGGDLAAEDREQRRPVALRRLRLDVEDVVAGDRRGVLGAVVVERADAAEAVDDVGLRRAGR